MPMIIFFQSERPKPITVWSKSKLTFTPIQLLFVCLFNPLKPKKDYYYVAALFVSLKLCDSMIEWYIKTQENTQKSR